MKRSLFVVVAFGFLAACTRTSGTVEIPPKDLPFSVSREPVATETSAAARTFTVYLVRGHRLVPVIRQIRANMPAPEAAMRALLDGPTATERSSGIGSELPAAVRLLTVDAGDGTATVDLSGEFQEPAQPERVALRVAQVTWTLTELPGVRDVAFAIDGEALSVATDDGTTVDRPVRRSDYAAFAPRV